MRRLLVVLLLAVGLFPVAGGTAWACSCAAESEQEQYRGLAREAELLYTGLVTSRQEPSPPAPGSPPTTSGDIRYTVRVEERLKGSVPNERVLASNQACAADLQPGRRALLIEFNGNGRVSLCDGTTQDRVEERAAIARDELRRQSLPETGSPATGTLAATSLIVAAAGVRRRLRA